MEDETRLGHETRKGSKPDSRQFITPTDKVSAKGILSALENAEFSLTDASYQRRLKENGQYHMVRFVFTRKGIECTPHPEFVRISKSARINLVRMLSDALWRCRAYLNHYEEEDRVSLNFEHRMPFIGGDGKPITEWQKDENGRRVGGGPVPLSSAKTLSIRGKEMVLR